MAYRILLGFVFLIFLTSFQSKAQRNNGYWIAMETSTYDKSNPNNASISVYALIYKDQKYATDGAYENKVAESFQRHLFNNILSQKEKSAPYIEYARFRTHASGMAWNNPDDIRLNGILYGLDNGSRSFEQITKEYIQSKKKQLGEYVVFQDENGSKHFFRALIRTFKLREDGKSFEDVSPP
ncbi:hypothetical protein [Pseudoxanthomonas mexicana]